jgi:hypothetical protein
MQDAVVVAIVHVAEHAAAGLDLGDAGLRRAHPIGSGAAAAHDADGQALRLARLRALHELADRGGDRLRFL